MRRNFYNLRYFWRPVWKRKSWLKSKLTKKLKHADSILEYFEYFCQMSSKSILIILSYTVSKFARFFVRHSVFLDVSWNIFTSHVSTASAFEVILPLTRYVNYSGFQIADRVSVLQISNWEQIMQHLVLTANKINNSSWRLWCRAVSYNQRLLVLGDTVRHSRLHASFSAVTLDRFATKNDDNRIIMYILSVPRLCDVVVGLIFLPGHLRTLSAAGSVNCAVDKQCRICMKQ